MHKNKFSKVLQTLKKLPRVWGGLPLPPLDAPLTLSRTDWVVDTGRTPGVYVNQLCYILHVNGDSIGA